MPGPEQYTLAEIMAMSREELDQAQARGFIRPQVPPLFAGEPFPGSYHFDLPASASPQVDKYATAAATWGSGGEFDFETPGGATCRLRPMPIEEMAASGMLDRLSRLPGITQALIRKSEGLPPEKGVDTAKALTELVDVLNELLPMVVMQPIITPIPQPNEDGTPGEREAVCIYPDSIPFGDRVAILNKVAGGLVKFDAFRGQS